jgi:geranylgeranyl diphosphate synthase type II
MDLQTGGALSAYLREVAAEINAFLERSIEPLQATPAVLHQAERYALLAPGKRLRGVTVLAVAEMLRGERATALPFAAAVEMVHASSLILDDLPSMDDATLRRGQTTLHRVHGEANAILVAVSFLTRAFELLAGNEAIASAVREEAALRLARAVGHDGLIGGQVADLEATGSRLDLGELEYVHAHKTGALFMVAAELGALVARARRSEMGAVQTYAKNLGLAFQITDDLLDASGDPATIGKDAGKDRNKTTFVDVCGSAGAQRLVDELIDTAAASLARFGTAGGRLRELAEMVRHRDR